MIESSEFSRKSVPSPGSELGTFPKRLEFIVGEQSVRAFARRCGMSDTVLRQYLAGKSEPTRLALISIAEAGNVRVEWLATGEGPMKRGEAEGSGLDLEMFALVPRYDVEVSAGGGTLIEGEAVIGAMAFKREWLKRMGLELQKLALVTAKGDSMEPTLIDGDMVLVDLRQTDIVDGAIHVLRSDSGVLVKRLQLGLDNQVIVRSDNKIYSALETTRDKLNVVGRVVWRGGRM